MLEESTPEGDIHYGYNNLNQHSETYTSNTDTSYGYDLLGRLASVTVTKLNGVTLATPMVTTYAYDADGNQAAEIDANGVLTSDSYDDLNRLTGVTEVKGSTTLYSEAFTLYADGSRHTAHQVQLQGDNSTFVTTDTTWTYDALVRLTGETVVSTAANESYTDTFTYDLVGNRLSKTHTGPGGGANESVTYSYNGDDQLKTQSSRTAGTTFTYDPNGSQLTSTANGSTTTTFRYDVRNKMVSATVNGSTAADGDGLNRA